MRLAINLKSTSQSHHQSQRDYYRVAYHLSHHSPVASRNSSAANRHLHCTQSCSLTHTDIAVRVSTVGRRRHHRPCRVRQRSLIGCRPLAPPCLLGRQHPCRPNLRRHRRPHGRRVAGLLAAQVAAHQRRRESPPHCSQSRRSRTRGVSCAEAARASCPDPARPSVASGVPRPTPTASSIDRRPSG